MATSGPTYSSFQKKRQFIIFLMCTSVHTSVFYSLILSMANHYFLSVVGHNNKRVYICCLGGK